MYNLSRHEVVQSFSRNDSEVLLEKHPEILQTNFGEYFENEEKRKKVRLKFQNAVFSKIIHRKTGSNRQLVTDAGSPKPLVSSFSRQTVSGSSKSTSPLKLRGSGVLMY
jgi:hypothetical protein